MTNIEENKKELKKKIDDIKGLIKANSKDAHYADNLISELLSLHKELKHEPTLVHIPMDSIEKSHKGDTFDFVYTKKGEGVFRTNGYTLICNSPFYSLNRTISEVIDYFNGEFKDLDEKQKELMEQDIMATQWVISLPIHACSDLEFKYELTKRYMEWCEKVINKSNEAELQEETVEEDKQFEEAMKGIEEVREIIGEEVKKIKEK